MEKSEHDLIKEANELLRSAHSIAERKGIETNLMQLKRVLKEQLEYLYPTQKQIRLKKLNRLNENR